MSDFALDTDFGVIRGGIDDLAGVDSTSALQAAFDACYADGRHLVLTKGSAFISSTLLNRGVPLIGGPAKATSSVLRPMTTMPSTSDFIKFEPNPGAYQDFMRFEGFRIEPTIGATSYGRHAFYGLFDGVTNVAKFCMDRLYLGKGADYSIQLENSQSVNPQGVPSYSSIKNCSIFDGVKLVKVGDNFVVEDNYIQTTPGVYRHGVWADIVNGVGGEASMCTIRRNAIQAQGAAIQIDSGRNVRVEDNNLESSYGSGSSSGAVVDFAGNNAPVVNPIFRGNAIGVFGASSCQNGVRFGTTIAPFIDQNDIITDVARAQAILILPATSASVLGVNKIGPAWTHDILNYGSSTILNPGTSIRNNA